MTLIADIALTHLRGRLRQTLVAIVGVATGVGFSIAMASLMEGSQRDFIETLVDTTPHVIVKDEHREPPLQPVAQAFAEGAVALRGQKPKEELRGIRNARARLAEIDRMAGITAAPILRGQVVIRFGGRDVAASLIGIETERERRVSNIEEDLREGSLQALHTAANGIIVGIGLADRLGATMGDTLIVTSPAGALLRMKIVGIFRTGMVSIDNSETYALLKKVQVLQNRPNVVNQIRVRVADVEQASGVARRIETLVGYRTESWDEANEGLLEVLIVRNVIMFTVVGAILLVASFGIFNVVSTIIHEKARDIAILKSLGFLESDIRRIFVLEGVALGAIGSLLGWALGLALTVALGAIVIDVKTFTEQTGLPVYYSVWHYLIAAAFALSAATFAGWLPARRAAAVDPVAIIRGAA